MDGKECVPRSGIALLERTNTCMTGSVRRDSGEIIQGRVAVVSCRCDARFPIDLQVLAGLAYRKDRCADYSDAIRKSEHIHHSGDGAHEPVVDLFGHAMLHGAGLDHGVKQTREVNVEPVLSRAVDLGGNVEPWCIDT